MDPVYLLAGSGAIGGVLVTLLIAGRLWRPLRKLIAVIDALAGRPARYDGDDEARPGLVERLDGIDKRLECVDGRVTRIEQATTGANGEPLPQGQSAPSPSPPARDHNWIEPETVQGSAPPSSPNTHQGQGDA